MNYAIPNQPEFGEVWSKIEYMYMNWRSWICVPFSKQMVSNKFHHFIWGQSQLCREQVSQIGAKKLALKIKDIYNIWRS